MKEPKKPRAHARWLTFPWVILPAEALAILLLAPSLEIGFAFDDYAQIGLIEVQYEFEAPAVNLYGPTAPAS